MPTYPNSDPIVSGIDPVVLAAQRQVNDLLAQMPHPDVHTAEGLAILRAGTANNVGDTVLRPQERSIAGPRGDLTLRIFQPPGTPRGVMLRIHGGGWAAGRASDDDVLNDRLARQAGVVVVSPEYGLVPDVAITDQIADCVAAAEWLGATAGDEFGSTRLLIGGTSAGAHLAAATLLRLRGSGSGAFELVRGVHLDCGAYDLAGTPSVVTADDTTLILTHDWIYGLLELGLPGYDLERRRDPVLSPALADLTGMPPALFTVGALDPLRDDSALMAFRWQLAGGDAQLDVWPEGAHAFTNMATPLGEVAFERTAAWLSALLG